MHKDRETEEECENQRLANHIGTTQDKRGPVVTGQDDLGGCGGRGPLVGGCHEASKGICPHPTSRQTVT